ICFCWLASGRIFCGSFHFALKSCSWRRDGVNRLGGILARALKAFGARRCLVMEQEQVMSLIQAKRASEVLSVSLARLYELARLGVIPVVRLGPRQIRFDEDALTRWVRQGGWVEGNGAAHASGPTQSGSKAIGSSR